MKQNNVLKRDLKEIEEFFPKLAYFETDKFQLVKGDIDICDTEGNYWETFKIAVVIPENYPFGVPQLFELSNIIDRSDKRHISKEGLCCVDMDHELIVKSRKGIKLVNYIKDEVYPFLSNQLYYQIEKKYASGDYKHYFEGVIQYYDQRLGLKKPELIIEFIEMILNNNLPGRNDPCPCGNGKFKFCHEQRIDFLKSVGKDRLKKDLSGFRELAE